MADLLQRPDLTQFRAFTAGDEHALIRIYRTQYDALLAQALEELGPDLAHFRARVAQQAMLSTWDHRGRYETVDGLTAALDEAIRDEAAVQRRKHAALHHGKRSSAALSHITIPTADEAVDRLLSELHAAPSDHTQALNDTLAASKHHAAAHVQKVAAVGGWQKPALLLVVAVAVIVVFMRWVGASSEDVAATQALEAPNARTVSSVRGQRGNVTLNDGSTARIGSDSRLKMPADFGGLVRTLELNGTAMFTVAPAQDQPFEVRARNVIVRATGTVFTVRAFEDDSVVYVGVDEGSVTVRSRAIRGETAVPAGKSLRVASDGSVAMLDDASRQLALEWVHDTLVFTNARVDQVLPELGRWFDLKALLADPALGARTVSLRIGLESSGEALRLLAEAARLSIGFDQDDKVVLRDSVATAPPVVKKRR